MTQIDAFYIQPFRLRRKRLIPEQRLTARTRSQALSEGQRMAGRMEGVAVVHVVVDDETGELSSMTVLARHGIIPEEFEEEVRMV